MYTQCPECATAFRVTAEILRQAAGKVRCGGCGNAFNALLYLSETRPDKPARPGDEAVALPELRPEEEGPDVPTEAPPPRAISPDQSQALLETLDELSGENIRLEDTGIEWRLLRGEDDDAIQTGATVDADISGDTGEARVDELLEDSPTPIDEYLTASPHALDAPEVFESSADTPAGSVEASEVFDNAAGEMRFDDNTGLPDDFDFDADELPGAPAPAAPPDPGPEARAGDAPPDGLKVDIAFGDPEEWQELLDELDDDPPPPVIDEHAAGAEKPAEFDGASDDDRQPLDLDTQFGLQAEALGILSPADEDGDAEVRPEQAPVPDTGDDLAETVVKDDLCAAGDDDEAGADDDEDEDVEPLRYAEDGGNDFDGAHPEEELYTADIEFELDETELDLPGSPDDPATDAVLADADADGADAGESAAGSLDESLEALLDPDFDDIEGEVESMPSAIHDLELELGSGEPPAGDDDGFDLVAGADDVAQPTILPMSEEEQTINQMIDEDMLRMAVEEDDGLSSSMVLKAADVESALAEGAEQAAADEDEEDDDGETDVGVETIIMEGEFVRTALEEEALREQSPEDEGPDDSLPDDGKPADENRIVAALRNTMHGRANDDARPAGEHRRHGLVAGVGVLALLLVGQLVHQSRAQLATIPALNGFIAPIYRALGAPITPDWDVTGWRFEVTRGSTNAAGLADELAEDGRGVDFGAGDDGDPEVLTIYSRIGNQADKALPYPLVSVSLTDRFEEIIGSRVLSPNDYLTGDFDPRRFVPPGETFNAVITIDSPTAAATGFKLNVCYREAGGKLRCAVEDFL